MKKKPFAFRISESGYKTLKQKSKRGKVTMTEFLERAITDKEIVVVDGVQELISELKAIGRNLNQLTTLAMPFDGRIVESTSPIPVPTTSHAVISNSTTADI